MADEEEYTDAEVDEALGEVLADMDDEEVADLAAAVEEASQETTRSMSRFDRLVAKLVAKGHDEESAKRLAAHIGRRKYGVAGFAALAAAGRAKAKAAKSAMRSRSEPCWCGQPARSSGFCAEHATFDRVFPLLDYEIVRSGRGGDGRTVDAYVSVFDTETEINDQYGRYREAIHPSAFARTLNRADLLGSVKVLLNHGMTLDGAPAPFGSIPVGVPVDIRSDGRGLRTRTRYNEGEYADAVLSALKNGAMSGHSFRGRVYKSNPDRVPRIMRGGALPLVTRMELGLSEYGPTPIPFYADAGVIAIRSRAIADAQRLPYRERIVIARALLDPADEPPQPIDLSDTTDLTESEVDEVEDAPATPDESTQDVAEDPADASGTPDDSGLATEDPAQQPLPPVEPALHRSQVDIRRRIEVWRILNGGN